MTGAPECELTLFVTGASDLSARAITDARALCDIHLEGRCVLAIVDAREEPVATRLGRVLATPTLIKMRPLPVRKVVGDLSDATKVLLALGLRDRSDEPNEHEGSTNVQISR
jgi:circadian clock protein KaiB